MDLSQVTISLQSALLIGEMIFCFVFSLLLIPLAIRNSRPASLWLSLILFLTVLYLVPWAAGHLGWYAVPVYRKWLFYLPFQQLLLLGPCIYFYVVSLLDTPPRLDRVHFLHLLPGGLYLLYSLVVFLTDTYWPDVHYFYADGRDKDLAPWYQVVGLSSMACYTGLSIGFYRRYRRQISDEVSYSDAITYTWVRRYLVLLLVLVFLRLFFLVAYPNFGSFGQKFWYYLAFGFVSGSVGLAGYTEAIRRGETYKLILPDLFDDQHSETSDGTSYADIPAEQLAAWRPGLIRLMHDQEIFRDPRLSLSDLAEQLQLTRRQTSALVNIEFRRNFNDLVNGYRVEAVKQSFLRGEHRTHTLLATALDAGFNSKTTFNRVFKRETGLTPRQYLLSIGKN